LNVLSLLPDLFKGHRQRALEIVAMLDIQAKETAVQR